MRLTRSCALALLLSSAPIFAQQASTAGGAATSDDIIMGASLDPATCNVENAVPLSFDNAVTKKQVRGKQCVKIDGFWSGRALFRSAADANSKLSNVSRKLASRRIGLYGAERLLASAPSPAKRYTLVGQLRRCESAWPRAMMVMGYCHYTGGPFLIASEALAQDPNVR